MTHQQLRELCEKATQPRPWTVIKHLGGEASIVDDNDMWVAEFGEAPEDAEYACEAANAVPALLDENDALLAALREACELASNLLLEQAATLMVQARLHGNADWIEVVMKNNAQRSLSISELRKAHLDER